MYWSEGNLVDLYELLYWILGRCREVIFFVCVFCI